MESTDLLVSDVSYETVEPDPAAISSFDFGSGMITNVLLLVAIFFLIMLFTRSRR